MVAAVVVERGVELAEQHRLLGHLRIHLGDVLAVVRPMQMILSGSVTQGQNWAAAFGTKYCAALALARACR